MGENKIKTVDGSADQNTESKAAPKAKRGKKNRVQVPRARIFVQSTYNNTIITFADMNGNVLGWGTAGKTGFKGSRKSTPYAAQRTMEETIERLKPVGVKEADVVVKGVGIGRESAIRALIASGISVLSIKDKTPIPHGGIRAKKSRRV